MRCKFIGLVLLLATQVVSARWQTVNKADFTWGPFTIYNISLLSKTGGYKPEQRPLMLHIEYEKHVNGRDFAVSLARSWDTLNREPLENQDQLISNLKKSLPNLKPEDTLNYVALKNNGYFAVNGVILPMQFDDEFNKAILAVWLDPDVEISSRLIEPKYPRFPNPFKPKAVTSAYKFVKNSSLYELIVEPEEESDEPNDE